MRFQTLTDLCRAENTVASTAHRGASYDYPENTILAMEKAIEAGTDFIEFDVRATSDHVPVILHDSTIDRTSNGTGTPESHTLAELKKYNFSYFRQFERLEKPFCKELPIPTFEEILQLFRGRAFMNIQIYLQSPDAMAELCRLYGEYDMYDQGYLTIADTAVADRVRKIDDAIEICLTPGWHERALPENLTFCRDYGCRFVQPTAESVSAETFGICRKLGLRTNVFFADYPEDFERLIEMGADGIMTNRINTLTAYLP